MLAKLLLASAALAQLGVAGMASAAEPDRVDVGYEQLASGQPDAAIARIQATSGVATDDPAALINLGAAHARMGRTSEAHDFYMAAIASRTHYDLQLADGTWMDSRRAARLAAENLARSTSFASRR